MAWGGKFSRMTEKQRRYFLRHANRRLPPPENLAALIPTEVLEQLGREQLPNSIQTYTARLHELLRVYQFNIERS